MDITANESASMAELVRALEERFGGHPVRRFLDFRIGDLALDRCVMTIEFRPEFDNMGGAVHGGILAMLADTAAACALSTSYGGAMNFATSNLNIHFLRRASNAVTATASIIKKGRKVCVASVEIHDSEGLQVATATCDFVLHHESSS
ncbi:MAG TPA: PaaI family thioesterase [Thermoanaerobaculia bacterium]|nr:PaaI family thioesterase [Thermoanaerobaculia bacterium]